MGLSWVGCCYFLPKKDFKKRLCQGIYNVVVSWLHEFVPLLFITHLGSREVMLSNWKSSQPLTYNLSFNFIPQPTSNSSAHTTVSQGYSDSTISDSICSLHKRVSACCASRAQNPPNAAHLTTWVLHSSTHTSFLETWSNQVPAHKWTAKADTQAVTFESSHVLFAIFCSEQLEWWSI